jgi:superoxide dismutase
MKKYKLPELPYNYSALEPHYSAPLLELAFWKVVNWEDVAQRFQKVRTLDLAL